MLTGTGAGGRDAEASAHETSDPQTPKSRPGSVPGGERRARRRRVGGDRARPRGAAGRARRAHRWFDGTEPLPAEEAERALRRIHGTKDANELAADRAEALTQIQVAEATLESLATPAVPVEEPAPEPPPPAQPRRKVKKQAAHTERLRQVARQAVTASVNLRQAEAALERLPHPEPEVLAAVEQAKEAVGSARSQLDPARRRTVGALISATGMVIVISTVGWPASTYLVPTALVLVVTADMRVAGVNAKKTKERLDEELATFEAGNGVDLEAGRAQITAWQEASARRDDAARRHAEAWAAWEQVAPGTDPGDVEELIEAQARRPPRTHAPRPSPTRPPSGPASWPNSSSRTPPASWP